jgi:hypothetical protein
MNNENQIQRLYVQLDQYEMTGMAQEILTYLRNTYPEITRKIRDTRYEKSIPIPEQWELASLLVSACGTVYECEVLRAGLRRATHEIEKLRQLKLF